MNGYQKTFAHSSLSLLVLSICLINFYLLWSIALYLFNRQVWVLAIKQGGCYVLSIFFLFICLPSVLWHYWFGIRKSIRLVKNWVVTCWSEEQMIYWCYCHPTISCFVKIEIGLSFLVGMLRRSNLNWNVVGFHPFLRIQNLTDFQTHSDSDSAVILESPHPSLVAFRH